ncbi:MAG: hypothetical protein EZS28_003988 [Streblomastix strix]|uniref:Uncharacterized protein n=1 Tax=Streblomastix strix TaxID=222440 RepID=A0A5J4X099_9EUKA|nr:MAG: hypothetical protein EZS28_003988 [Streblomastix strix]
MVKQIYYQTDFDFEGEDDLNFVIAMQILMIVIFIIMERCLETVKESEYFISLLITDADYVINDEYELYQFLILARIGVGESTTVDLQIADQCQCEEDEDQEDQVEQEVEEDCGVMMGIWFVS